MIPQGCCPRCGSRRCPQWRLVLLRAYAEAGMAAPPLPKTDTQCRADLRKRAGVDRG